MANFTTVEANASTIVRMEKKMRGGVFSGWVFGATDADGNYIDWKDSSVAENASKATIKTAIRTHLEGTEKRSAPVATTYESITDKGKGETVA